MSSSIEQLLVAEAGITPQEAKVIAPFFESYETPEKQHELETLVRTSKPGQAAAIICRKPRNLLFNWRECMVKIGISYGAAGASGTPAAYIGATLKTIYDLWEGTKIQLGPKHAKVVEALWIKNLDDNPVAMDAIASSVSDGIDRAELQRLLQDLSVLHVITQEQGKIRKWDKLILR